MSVADEPLASGRPVTQEVPVAEEAAKRVGKNDLVQEEVQQFIKALSIEGVWGHALQLRVCLRNVCAVIRRSWAPE